MGLNVTFLNPFLFRTGENNCLAQYLTLTKVDSRRAVKNGVTHEIWNHMAWILLLLSHGKSFSDNNILFFYRHRLQVTENFKTF